MQFERLREPSAVVKLEHLIIIGAIGYLLYRNSGGGPGGSATGDQKLGGGLSPSGTVYMVEAVPGMPAHDVGRGFWTPL